MGGLTRKEEEEESVFSANCSGSGAKGETRASRGEAARRSPARDGPGTPLPAPPAAPVSSGSRPRPLRGRGECVRARACAQAGVSD